MKPFDPYGVKVPWHPELTFEEKCNLPISEKMRLISEGFAYTREKHAEWVRLRDPHATHWDILLEWLRLTDLKEDFLIGMMLAYPDRFIDNPVIVEAR